MALRTWWIVTSRSSITWLSRSATTGWVRQLCRRLQREPGREHPLDDVVVEIAGDALALLEQRRRLHVLVQPGVLDRQSGRRGERHDELLVDVGEHVAVGLVGEVEVAEHLVAQQDRHAEERRHRRVVRREAVAVGVGGEVGEAQRLGLDDQQPEDAVTFGEVADACRDPSSSMPTVMNSASRGACSSSTPSAP